MTMSETPTRPDLLIYGSPVSPFTRKAMACAHEKGVAVDLEAVDIRNMPDWFLEISPMRRIPVLRDRSIGDEGVAGTIADSSAICAYIERKHAEPALYPHAAYDYGRALSIEEYGDSVLAPAAGMGIFRPIFFAVMQKADPDVAAAQEAWETKLPPVLDFLDSALDGRDFLVGETMTISDIAVTCCFMQIGLVANVDVSGWPNFAAHCERMQKRDSIAEPFARAEHFVRKVLPERVSLT
jgi:glutathione S-transferase